MASISMNDKRLNEKQAAQYLGISLPTIKRKRYNEEIGFYRIGNNIRYSIENHLNPYLERCECKLASVEDMGLEP